MSFSISSRNLRERCIHGVYKPSCYCSNEDNVVEVVDLTEYDSGDEVCFSDEELEITNYVPCNQDMEEFVISILSKLK